MLQQLPLTPETLNVARRVVWFKSPREALQDPYHFLAHVMTYGTPEDLIALRGIVSQSDYRDALSHAPPGIMDARSWAYWHLKLHGTAAPPMPTRRFE